ncbi:MAG: CHAT domain-containing protein [Bacteroidia bacterium]|nr:CHAT domain-containing protein [Bacteroidia bacterium]
MRRLVLVWIGWLHAQGLPFEKLYFSGKVSSFGKKVTAAYKRAIRGHSSADPATLGVALAYALYQSDIHDLKEAETALRPYLAILQGSGNLPAQLRLYYHWIEGRLARRRGYLKYSSNALRQGYTFTQSPWELALLRLEMVENLLLLGNATAAQDTLSQLPLSDQLQEPYRSYLQARADYLKRVILWEKGEWDSLLVRPTHKPKNQLEALYESEYAYLKGLAAFMQGNVRTSQKFSRTSIHYAKKTVNKGKDLVIRAEALRLLGYYTTTYKIRNPSKLRYLNPLIKAFSSPALPTSYATIQALEHIEAIGRITRRSDLAENILSNRLSDAEGLRNIQIQRLASQAARAQYRGTIALGYASQAALRAKEEIDFPSVEGALSLAELGEAALVAYHYPQADTAFSEAYGMLIKLGEPEGPRTLPLWASIGRYKLTAGRYKEAERVFLRQRDSYKRLLGMPEKNLNYLRNELALAQIALRLDEVAKAETLLSHVDKLIQDMGDVAFRERIALEESQGDLAQAKGQFREAERHYLEAIRLRQRYKRGAKDTEEIEGSSLLRLALLYQKTGRLSRAREVYQRIGTAYDRRKQEDADMASFYIGLTDFYLAIGDYLKAEESARKARDINKKLFGEASPGYIEAILASARVERALGRYEKQKAFLSAALTAQRSFYQDKPTIALGRTLYLLAENALLSNRPDTAVRYLTKSSDEARKVQDSAPVEFASLSLDISGIWLGLDSLARAEEQLSMARAVLESQVPSKHPLRLSARLHSARLLRAKGEYLSALREYSVWLNQWKTIYGTQHPEYPFHLAEQADLYWLARDLSSAKNTYKKAVSLLLTQVDRLFNGLTENEKARYWIKVRRVLEHYYAFSFTLGTDRDKLQAYETYLTTKAFLLSETAQLRARLSASRDSTIQRLFKEWQDQKEYVVRLYAYTPAELKELNINLPQEEEQLNQLEKALTQYIGDIRLKPVSWKSLRAAIPSDGAAIDWIKLRLPLMRDSVVYYAVLTLPSKKAPLFIAYPNGHLLETIGLFRYTQSILNFETDTTSYGLYWAPLANALPPSVSKLYLSNDGVFNQMNLSTLRLPSGGYLADKYQIIYHTRLANLAKPPKPLRYWEGRKAFIVANPDYAAGIPADSINIPPLPGTDEEARAIRDILRSEGILPYVYTRSEAGETVLYETVSPYILHIATHGLFLPYSEGIGSLVGIQSAEALSNPLFRSALLLADAGRSMLFGSQDTKRDGIANAYELLSLDLSNTELVVLSACETGLGDIQNGEGVYGLQRAFLLAGARHLVVSLWRVDDEATRDFMITFYDEWLRKKLPIVDAFWNAQKAMRKARSAPYFWGAFVLVRP